MSPEGRWQNWTVTAVEEQHGYQTYRVQVEYSSKQVETPDTTWWLDIETLGMIRDQHVDGSYGYGDPAGPIMPMINRTYDVNWTIIIGAHRIFSNETFEDTIFGWGRIRVPAGEFAAVEFQSVEKNTNRLNQHAWYSPHVGNLVRHTFYGPFELVSWHRASAGSQTGLRP